MSSRPKLSTMQIFRRIFPTFCYTRQQMLEPFWLSSTRLQSSTTQSHEKVSTEPTSVESHGSIDEGEEFRHLLRHSSFVNMGDPQDKVARGIIYHVVNDDLYVDFGWKFHCVCAKPVKGGEHYVRGAEVLLKIKNLEISSKFLGSDRGITLLEADASIIKLLSVPIKHESQS